MRVLHVPQLADNYGYLLIDDRGEAAIVDPAEAEVVLAAVAHAGVRLSTVLATHHHGDHVGGIDGLLAALPHLIVIGNAADAARIPHLNRPIQPGDTFQIGTLQGQMLPVPCHTSGHVAYLFEDALFSGDTLFAAGCGRFFEGTASEMYRALYEVIGPLPDTTRVYCGHEYTETNLRFAATLEPNNPAITQKLAAVRTLRAAGHPSTPTQLGEEKTYNPFLRVTSLDLIASVRASTPQLDAKDPIAILATIRSLKDVFR